MTTNDISDTVRIYNQAIQAYVREMLHIKMFAELGPEYDLPLIHSFWFYLPLEYIKVIMILGSSRNTRQPAVYGHLSNQGFSVLNLIQVLAGCLTPLPQSIEEGKI